MIRNPRIIRRFFNTFNKIQYQSYKMESQNLVYGVPEQYSKKQIAKYSVNQILRIEEVVTNFDQYIGKVGTVAGWSRTVRAQANDTIVFIELSDGTTMNNLQIVCNNTLSNFKDILKSGVSFSFRVTGLFVKSPGKGQNIEILCENNDVHSVKILGNCDQKQYPLAKKHHKPETLREIAHLRPRTNLISCVARVRNALAYATHTFFQTRGFLLVNTPLITASDCEGAGEMFKVTTAMDKQISKIPTIPKKDEVDYSKDFFKKPAFLTVSGQLALENYSCGLSNVYTFGPTFRAENSNTTKHLAEFWMLEPEISFADIHDDMDLAEDYLKYLIHYTLENCQTDLAFFNDRVKKGQIDYITKILNSSFQRVDYAVAVEALQKVISEGHKFENYGGQVKFGDDLAQEHEKYLTEHIYNGPIFLYNFPKEIKSFYMKLNDDNRTVAAFDALVPQIGEIIGGSQREDCLETLERRMIECNLNPKDYWWYSDLRRYGTVPHAGFGAGFERLVMFITGVENIRDVIPFPRYPGHVEF